MIQIGKTLVSLDILEKEFVCDLSACKGACCVEGDAGAPLEEEEVGLLQEEWEKIKPYIREEGIAAIEAQGTFVIDPYDQEKVTPLVEGKECAYTIFDEKGVAGCGIEKAWQDGATQFRKPVSCHLYPIRISKHKDFEAVNYDKWKICSPACACGKKLGIEVFRFVKEALIRKYGEAWYKDLEVADEYAKKVRK